MSLILQAPATNPETTTTLPNPEFSDVQSRKISVEVRRSMNNTKRTYVKSGTRQALSYSFTLHRAKALELRAFVLSYFRVPVYLTNHKDEKWIVYFTNNPIEFNGAGRGERTTVTLNFEGVQQ